MKKEPKMIRRRVAAKRVATKPGVPKAPKAKVAVTAPISVAAAIAAEAAAARPDLARDLSKDPAKVEQDWVDLFPQGISVTSQVGRPVLVLKDLSGVEVLPVWMSPLDAGIALSELSSTTGATPHLVSRRLMESLKIRAVSCSFLELIGHHQYVLIEFEGSSELKGLRVRADEAMSFCVQARVKFRATREFMLRCRDVDADMEKLESANSTGNLAASALNSENSSKKHTYVI